MAAITAEIRERAYEPMVDGCAARKDDCHAGGRLVRVEHSRRHGVVGRGRAAGDRSRRQPHPAQTDTFGRARLTCRRPLRARLVSWPPARTVLATPHVRQRACRMSSTRPTRAPAFWDGCGASRRAAAPRSVSLRAQSALRVPAFPETYSRGAIHPDAMLRALGLDVASRGAWDNNTFNPYGR